MSDQDLPNDLEELQALIQKQQADLRLMHAHKRSLAARKVHQDLMASRDQAHEGEKVALTTAAAPVVSNLQESGLPTPPSGVDMAQSDATTLDARPPAPAPRQEVSPPQPPQPPPPAPDPKSAAFAFGAGEALNNRRGPLQLDLRTRK